MPPTSQIQMQTPPAELLPEHLRQPVERYHALVADMQATGKQVRDLARQLPNAEAADRQALAAALRDGKKDPGTAQADKVRAEQNDARRRLDGYQTAVADARRELEAAVVAARPDWSVTIADTVTEAEADYRDAVTELDRAHHRMATSRAVAAWLERFPHKPVLTLPNPSVAGTSWSQLIAAMADHGTARRPRSELALVDEKPPLDAA